jgi:hypothetical protein
MVRLEVLKRVSKENVNFIPTCTGRVEERVDEKLRESVKGWFQIP